MDTSSTQCIAPTEPITRLRGGWLWVGRAVWLILFATGLALAAGVITNPSLIFFTRDAFEFRPACQVLRRRA